MKTSTAWPKILAPLTAEQQRISDDWMHYWHEILPQKYALAEKFNHSYPVKWAPAHFQRTLEVGAGRGGHLAHEKLTPEQESQYYALELRDNMSAEIRKQFPRVQTVTADCQQRLEFEDGFFDRIIAIHVLEHLPNLPAAVREFYRVCNKDHGVLSVVIPCEGGAVYAFARYISSQRLFQKRYQQPYKWLIEREHINRPHEILETIHPYFELAHRSFFPLPIPLVCCNLVIGLTYKPRKEVLMDTGGKRSDHP